MKLESLINERNLLRERWSEIRLKRLDLKNTLAEENPEVSDLKRLIRTNSCYKKLKKNQRHISKMIKHIDDRIRRELFREQYNEE